MELKNIGEKANQLFKEAKTAGILAATAAITACGPTDPYENMDYGLFFCNMKGGTPTAEITGNNQLAYHEIRRLNNLSEGDRIEGTLIIPLSLDRSKNKPDSTYNGRQITLMPTERARRIADASTYKLQDCHELVKD